MHTQMDNRIVLDDQVWAAVATAALSYAAVLALYLGAALFLGVPTWMTVATWIGLGLMVALHGTAPWYAAAAILRAWRIRRAFATAQHRDLLHAFARRVALDHLAGFNEADLRGPTLSATIEWNCLRDSCYPMLIRLHMGDGGQHSARPTFTSDGQQRSYQLLWTRFGIPRGGRNLFVIHTTVSGIPAGSAHARLQRAHLLAQDG